MRDQVTLEHTCNWSVISLTLTPALNITLILAQTDRVYAALREAENDQALALTLISTRILTPTLVVTLTPNLTETDRVPRKPKPYPNPNPDGPSVCGIARGRERSRVRSCPANETSNHALSQLFNEKVYFLISFIKRFCMRLNAHTGTVVCIFCCHVVTIV